METAQNKVREFLVKHTDDYRSGPHLECIELPDPEIGDDEAKEKLLEDNFFEADFELLDNKYHVFHLSIDFCIGNTYLLKSFDSKDDAVNYAKQQYVLFTGSNPFMSQGMTVAYHPKGDRPEINIDGMTCDIVNDDDDGDNYEYIIIISHDYFESHSLNPFAVWE
jgi:hypothetical protein